MSIDWIHVTPGASLAGGLLIGAAASLLVLASGRVMGVSGIVGGLLDMQKSDTGWRLAFLLGLFLSSTVLAIVTPVVAPRVGATWTSLVVAGLLVGFGSRLGSGCTSGHGICGLSRSSPRSIVATIAFMLAGFLTVGVIRHMIL